MWDSNSLELVRETLLTKSNGPQGGEERDTSWLNTKPLSFSILQEALREQYPDMTALTKTNALEICPKIKTLSLHFRGIGTLDFVWMFRSLTKLELSNNNLSTLRGIEKLTRLRWLDLSFNKIKKLSSLTELVNLEVLSLHSNQLERLERGALAPLLRLQVLSLAHNLLSNKDDIRCLRHLPLLESVTLAANPLCASNYPEFVVAHLPRLIHLDHRTIPQPLAAKAAQRFRVEVALLEAEEATAEEARQKEAQERTARSNHARAGVQGLHDSSLFNSMLAGDKNVAVMLALPGAEDVMTRFRDQLGEVCTRVFNDGLVHQKERHEELHLFNQTLQEARKNADGRGRKIVQGFDTRVGPLLEEVRALALEEEANPGSDDEGHGVRQLRTQQLANTFCEDLSDTKQLLFEVEITLSDQIQELIDQLEDNLGKSVQCFLEEAHQQLEEGRRLAYTLYCKLRDLSTKLADIVVATSTDKRTLRVFEGGDTLSAVLAKIHDRHLALIDAREDALQKHLSTWLEETLHDISREEWQRNRNRVEEVVTFTRRQEIALSTALPQDPDEFL
ncbi:dynein regulatory complex subunit 3-like [Oratosquilla oratoria]|uniref:dynein regulatory complex subunit 3-like n=1 Tax=Oratosquilla oratoria TaxID=337810 RepID=UPI003F762C64